MKKHDKLVFVHLSDIHFVKADRLGGIPSVDADIRNQLILDAERLSKKLGAPHHILVSGDVAFSGSPDEYERAEKWLAELCARVGSEREKIRMVCGNHDVNRGAIRKSQTVQDIQKNLREKKVDEINEYVSKVVSDEFGGGIAIFASISNYCTFAETYQGHFNANRPIWDHTLVLNDGSLLVIRGLNSALASNEEDDFEHRKLVLGSGYAILQQQENVEYLAMCHHPPDWLRDQREVEQYLNRRARIQLFGHVHEPRIENLNKEGFQYLRLHAGAVNPERPNGPQRPCYNWFTLEVKQEGGKRLLEVSVWPRIWIPDKTEFDFDPTLTKGKEWLTFSLELPALKVDATTARQALVTAGGVGPVPSISDPLEIVTREDKGAQRLVDLRKFAFLFLNLSYTIQVGIANELELLRPEDRSISPTELFRRLFERAEQKRVTARFWALVHERKGERLPEINPFQ